MDRALRLLFLPIYRWSSWLLLRSRETKKLREFSRENARS